MANKNKHHDNNNINKNKHHDNNNIAVNMLVHTCNTPSEHPPSDVTSIGTIYIMVTTLSL